MQTPDKRLNFRLTRNKAYLPGSKGFAGKRIGIPGYCDPIRIKLHLPLLRGWNPLGKAALFPLAEGGNSVVYLADIVSKPKESDPSICKV